MAKKVKKKAALKTKVKQSNHPLGFFYFKRLVIVSAIAAVLFTGFLALTQPKAWFFLITGKEQFLPYNSSQTVGYYEGKTFQVPPVVVAAAPQQEENVLGDTATSNKRIEVDLANQRVYAFEGSNKVYDFVVSTGKYGRTPTGEFTVQRRVPVQTMSGGNKAIGTYYYLPGVKYVQYIGNSQVPWWKGYSFHSTYWHNNFGHPMSHGCINMKLADAETLWNWTGNVGTKVSIYGTAPAS